MYGQYTWSYCTWIWRRTIIVEYRVQEIAEVSFFRVSVYSVLSENILAVYYISKQKIK